MRLMMCEHPQIARDESGRLVEHPALLQKFSAFHKTLASYLGRLWDLGAHPLIQDGAYVCDLRSIEGGLELDKGDDLLRNIAVRLRSATDELVSRSQDGRALSTLTSGELKVLEKLADLGRLTCDVYILLGDDERIPLPLPEHALLAKVEDEPEEGGPVEGVVSGIDIDAHSRVWVRLKGAEWMLSPAEEQAFEGTVRALRERLAIRGEWRRVNGQAEIRSITLVEEGLY